jgi:general secretion pathway protein D
MRLNRLASGDASDWVLSIPSSAFYTLFKTKSEARVLSAPRIRGVEGQAAELRLGEEIPVPVTTFVSQVGTGLANTPVTSFQYRNVGINVQITPKVFVDGTIELQLTLETSVLGEDRQVSPGQSAPVFRTRGITNVVRLRDGETNVIGGLIDSRERKVTSGLPGITDVPILNKLFAKNEDESSEAEVIFTVTPHIVRAPIVTEADFAPLPMGTEQSIRVPSTEPMIFTPPEEEPPPSSEVPPGPPTAPVEPEAKPEATEPPSVPEPPESRPPSAGPISLLFNPPTTTVGLGEQVELALVAGGADGLSSGEITIQFDAAALEATDVQAGPFLSIDGKQVTFAPIIEPGVVRIRFSREDDTLGLRGSGHIVRIVFQVKSEGPPRVVSATGTLSDPTGAPIPASFSSARIETQ